MSQSLIIFRRSGKIEYQSNNKVSPFNEFISSIVNETHLALDKNFYTNNLHQKRFYGYHKDNTFVALYFDAVTTIDSERVKATLSGIAKTFNKLNEDNDDNDDDEEVPSNDKLKKLIDLQINQLIKYKQVETPNQRDSPSSSVNNSGTSTPVKKGHANRSSASKKMRKWDGGIMVDDVEDKTLDYSEIRDDSVPPEDAEPLEIDESAFIRQNDLVLVNELNDILGDSDNDDDYDDNDEPSGKISGFFGKLSSYLGGSINVDEVSKKFNDHLISKNIAPQTAKIIIEKLKDKLGNKNVTMVNYKQALTEELTKILTPNVSTDLLYDIKRNKANDKPYVISVVGVNGVGKSTNLAKLAYWFLQNNLSVLICACDTFRSGAVEQLKVHVNSLKRLNDQVSNGEDTKIDIYEKGYGSGDHVVQTAKGAIQLAGQEKYDIVLIDTAGRTHSNTKLMAPLKKFGDAANPDRIIMVGEALVGTDSVEQAINFNNAFGNKRSLDFFIISKVDTVGDMVGTMINMVMATKVPILFIGTGQTYTDIKRLSIKTVVDQLMR
ncbi:GTP binding signal recognition particle receptor [Scheffersomyces coipomensis]|uniref:GTP binding signal recognition particle receptor n=1 Tax=Scheffersomyces coipomensis TaxID=1788519 RepID=UPI00315CF120